MFNNLIEVKYTVQNRKLSEGEKSEQLRRTQDYIERQSIPKQRTKDSSRWKFYNRFIKK